MSFRDELIEAGTKAMADMPPELQDYSSCAEVVVSATLAKVHRLVADRALAYDKQADVEQDIKRKMQGATLACLANDLLSAFELDPNP